jgi:integrase
LHSFRRSGAIEIFKRTGSITKLQKAMGHSSINVSLTYLRGLEIAELKEEDMPRKFEIEIIDSLSKKTDKELDKAILNPLQ